MGCELFRETWDLHGWRGALASRSVVDRSVPYLSATQIPRPLILIFPTTKLRRYSLLNSPFSTAMIQ
ncbi:hypothetical protein Y032_0313g2190 [Ancylostoma ceylanicum]|uniref:Uncharacterized protein n=1 Tax=Ancylostoma ceylanicum TaxID=53326 RepID=A0A016S1V1_9BILA|nr:hypothetical protein Y032_0313g2190 [Ancylostoma ceylanicum]